MIENECLGHHSSLLNILYDRNLRLNVTHVALILSVIHKIYGPV